MKYILGKHQICDMHVYFERAPSLRDMKYCEFFKTYDYAIFDKAPRYATSGIVSSAEDYNSDRHKGFWKIFESSKRKMCVYQRQHPERIIVRLGMVYIMHGEIWYLRLLLKEFAFTSYKDMLTNSFGGDFTSFQASCIARGILYDDNECVVCFEENMSTKSPDQLRLLLVVLALNGFPTLLIFNEERFRKVVYLDIYVDHARGDERTALCEHYLLVEIQILFCKFGKDMKNYGYTAPLQMAAELERALKRIDIPKSKEKLAEMMIASPNTEIQQELFDVIEKHLNDKTSCRIYIQGIAGCGKTTFCQKKSGVGGFKR